MPYGKKMPKKMGCSGGGPNMYKMGSKEKNTPMNFSDKAMMYMKNLPAMYGKPKMDGDPVKKKRLTPEQSRQQVELLKKLKNKLGRSPSLKEYNDAIDAAGRPTVVEGSRKRVTNEVKRKQAFDKLKAKTEKRGTRATKNEIDAINKKYGGPKPKMYGKKKK